MKTVILAGGLGKRLRPLTAERPKPLIEIGGKPILELQFDWLRKHEIREAILCVGFMREKIIDYVGDGERFGFKVEYAVEREPRGTGGALTNCKSLLEDEDTFMVINGDVMTDLNVMILANKAVECIGTIALVPLRSSYGIVQTDTNGVIREFREKPILKDYWINAGVYCLGHEVFDYLPEKGNIETTAFPRLAEEKKLRAVKYGKCFWRSIDVYKDIEEAEKDLRELGYIRS